MTPAAAFDLLTIGHSNQPADRFIGLLRNAGVTTVADVRSVPFSRRFPWFSAKALAERLAREGIAFLPLGDALGGRPRDPEFYCDGVADYEAMAAAPEFRAGLDQVADAMSRHRLCLMCAEREPLDCHRCLLLARRLAERGLTPGSSPGRRHDRAARENRGAAACFGEREGQGGRSFPGPEHASCRRLSPPRPCRGGAGQGLKRRRKIAFSTPLTQFSAMACPRA